ncbi:uncharacterized protein [Rutidosis leptorrhynchoides]|uniref:uncharacterized protein n=1 Tax=Rutidosis leptorrhynchoides TaxID=125765 RepID=UPI003A99876E
MALQYPLLFPYGEIGYHENIPYHCNSGRRKTSRGYITMREFYCYRIQQQENEGSPRYMLQNYQDAMALCREFDNPDLFITFTSNPKWPEIEGMLCFIEGQRATDCPEIVARIFKQKLDNLMNDIMKGNIFGTCEADINDLISAEIPNEAHDPEGYKAVTEYMLHGPYGRKHKDAPCMIDNRCSKHFPKPYYAETTIDEDGYANYRCRNNGVNVTKGKSTLDNSFVVPYNRYLLIRYNAHINVEWCNRSRAIKYLFKYLNKGPDRATIVIQENVLPTHNSAHIPEKIIDVDEIKNYLDCRYLSPCEAAWRLFSYDIHFSKPSVIKLSYHLPNQQSLTLHDSQHLSALLQRPSIKETMFTQWDHAHLKNSVQLTARYTPHSKTLASHMVYSTMIRNGHKLFLKQNSGLQPDPSLLTQLDNRLIREELNYNIKEMKTLHDNLFRSLNPEQLTLYERLIKAVTNQEGGLYFLYGPGGTGKTFLYNTILTKLRSEKMIVLAVASWC